MRLERIYCETLACLFVPLELIYSHDRPALGTEAFLPVARLLDLVLLRPCYHLLTTKFALLALLMGLQVLGAYRLPASATVHMSMVPPISI